MCHLGVIETSTPGLLVVIQAELETSATHVELDTTSDINAATDIAAVEDATDLYTFDLEKKRKRAGRPSGPQRKRKSAGRPANALRASPDDISKKRAHEEILSPNQLIEKDKQDSRLKTSEDEYNLGAFVIDDINDLVFRMISWLPMLCWLQLDADYPRGQYYIPGLSVNKLLNVTAKSLKDLLASSRIEALSHIMFSASSCGRLSRRDGKRGQWIYFDLTGQRPHEGPGY